MEYRKMERLGVSTSLLGFGCMRFPTTPEGAIDEVRAAGMLKEAMAAGVNYIDTAYPYHNGESEPFVGSVLKEYERSSFFLATKLPVWLVKERADVRRIFEEQLSRLQTDYIDFYLMHAMGKERFDAMKGLGVIEELEQLKQQGKIRYLGFSFHDSYEAFEEILTYRDWDFCQIQYNYMDTEEQAGDRGYALCEKLNVPLIIMEPIKGGSLAAFSEDIRAKFTAARPDCSVASWALRWVASKPQVKVVLSGMSTEEQVRDNLSTFAKFEPLSAAELAVVEDVVKEVKSRINVGCTACRYCMPCPFGIDIPRNFAIWNRYGMYRNVGDARWNYLMNMKPEERADQCKKCGKCETVCPQHLPIRKKLAAMAEELRILEKEL